MDDLVTLAAPHHGTTLEGLSGVGCGACFQMTAGSRFLARLNSGDETPGDVDYTSIFTELADEMVQPQPTASTLFGGGVNVANISIQGIGGQCAARPVTHASIVIDSVTHDLVLDALVNDGPASVARAQPDCNPANPYFPILPEAVGGETTVEVPTTDLTIPPESILSEEPTTRYYARPVLPRYLDVPPDHWAYWEIAWADASELAVSDGRWIPDRPGSRAQTVMWLWRLAGGPTGSPPAAEFGHVADDAWYRDGLDWAAAEGIVHSVDGRFRPRRQVDRAHLAWWLWTYAGRPVGSPDHSFVDVPDGAWYEDGLDWVAAQGIVTGYPGNRFEPKRVSSRAAVVGTLYRLDGSARLALPQRSPPARSGGSGVSLTTRRCHQNRWNASRGRPGAVWTRDAPLHSRRPGRARRRPPRPDPRHRHER